jgi:NAD(P)-dependent dehydrogenase (short-subunit alcohol dehydrogenase family)
MKKVTFFGGTGGLGSQIIPHLTNYKVNVVGSLSVNFEKPYDIANYFSRNSSEDVVVIFTNYNYNSFLHKYKNNQEELKKQIDINIFSVTSCISHALDMMRTRGYGRIILASSVTVDKNVMGTSIYAATKAYYENIVKTIAIENASKGITANCIQLGYMDGGLTYTLSDNFIQETIEKIPVKRLGTAKEIAQTIEFLIETEYVNGTTLKLTGGL